MELKQQLLHRKYHKGTVKNQITIGEDYSLPEGKPDIADILLKQSEISIEEVHPEKGKIRIRGVLKLRVCYLTERSEKTADCLMMEFPFDEMLYMEEAANGDHLKVEWELEELRIEIIHPGKLSVRAVVSLCGVIMSGENQMLTRDVDGNGEICTQTEKLTAAETVVEQKESYRFKEEILLPANKPNVQTVLWTDLQLRGLELRLQDGRVALKGEVLFFVLYQEEEAAGLHWLEQTIPFQGALEVPDVTPEMFGLLKAEISRQTAELKPDYDGEMRSFLLEMIIDLYIHLYEERTRCLLTDAYSTREQLNLKRQELTYEKLRFCNLTKCRVSGQAHGKSEAQPVQILGHQAKLAHTNAKMTEQGILWEAVLEVQILYRTDREDQIPESVTAHLPCTQLLEVMDIKKEDEWRVSGLVSQIMLSISDRNQIEIRGSVDLNVCVMEQCLLSNVVEIEAESYDPEEYKNRPGMCIHFVQPGETLWKIAKNHHCTAEKLKELNELGSEEVKTGQRILILKQDPDHILHSIV